MKTYMPSGNASGKWYVLDAQGQTFGRLASRVAYILRGKHRPDFTPHVCLGDHVIVVNIDKVVFTGHKLDNKTYRHHTGYPGGLKETSYRELMQKKPAFAFELAVKGMLPKNAIGREMFRKLKVYTGPEHQHSAQMPEPLEM